MPNMVGLGNTSTSNSTMTLGQAWELHMVEDKGKEELIPVNNHRFRQLTFYNACIKDLRQKNKTWMVHIDSDEYVAVNHLIKSKKRYKSIAVPNITKPGSILHFIKRALQQNSVGMRYVCYLLLFQFRLAF